MKKNSRLPAIVFICIIAIAIIAGVLVLFNDTDAPIVTLSPNVSIVSTALPMTLTVEDTQNSIKKITVVAKWSGREIPVYDKTFSDAEKKRIIALSLGDTGIKEGNVELQVSATDSSFAGFGFGNTQKTQYSFTIDNTPPRVSIKTSQPNIRRGGAGVIAYSVSKDVSQTGIKVDKYFFPGFKQKNGDFLCFFAYPYHLANETFIPKLVAVDTAGNVSVTDVGLNKIYLNFKEDTIPITPAFLDKKADEFHKILSGDMPLLERFLQVNSVVRKSNADTLMQVGRNTSPAMLWNNSFLALPRGAVKALFAEHRTYMWEGKEVDNQTHLGYDLASVKNAPVPAANSGKIVFADYLGIYGNLVVIDHGLGVQSLYSHLSEIAVQNGQEVKRGDTIGKTGISGIALGDHLHFGILVSGLEVAPAEWLDANWLKNNITNRIIETGGTAPVFGTPAPPADAKPAAAKPSAKPKPKPAKKPATKSKRTN